MNCSSHIHIKRHTSTEYTGCTDRNYCCPAVAYLVRFLCIFYVSNSQTSPRKGNQGPDMGHWLPTLDTDYKEVTCIDFLAVYWCSWLWIFEFSCQKEDVWWCVGRHSNLQWIVTTKEGTLQLNVPWMATSLSMHYAWGLGSDMAKGSILHISVCCLSALWS